MGSELNDGINEAGTGMPAQIGRRTIVKGAAWSIPMTASEVNLKLAFSVPAYSGNACMVPTLTVSVLDENDRPVPNSPVLITFSDPSVRWNDGSSSKTFVSDGNGKVHTAAYTSNGGQAQTEIVAASGVATDSSTLSLDLASIRMKGNAQGATAPANGELLPGPVKKVGYGNYGDEQNVNAVELLEDGRLYVSNKGSSWKLVSSDVTDFATNPGGASYYGSVVYSTADNTMGNNAANSVAPGGGAALPGPVKKVGYGNYGGDQNVNAIALLEDGRLYSSNKGGAWALVSEKISDFATNVIGGDASSYYGSMIYGTFAC